MGDLKQHIYFLIVLEAKGPKSSCQHDHEPCQGVLLGLFLGLWFAGKLWCSLIHCCITPVGATVITWHSPCVFLNASYYVSQQIWFWSLGCTSAYWRSILDVASEWAVSKHPGCEIKRIGIIPSTWSQAATPSFEARWGMLQSLCCFFSWLLPCVCAYICMWEDVCVCLRECEHMHLW